MIEEEGVIVSVQGDMAEVEAQRRGACGNCAVNGACGTSLVARHFGRKPLLLQAYNAIGAGPGDRVVIALPEGALLQASAVVYLVPLLALIGGGMAGAYLAGLMAPVFQEALSILAALGGLAAALAWLVRFGRAKSSDDRYRPQVLRRTGPIGQGQAVRLQSPDLAGKQHRSGV